MLRISLKEVLILHAQEKVLRRFVQIVQDHAVIRSIKIKSFSSKEHECISHSNRC